MTLGIHAKQRAPLLRISPQGVSLWNQKLFTTTPSSSYSASPTHSQSNADIAATASAPPTVGSSNSNASPPGSPNVSGSEDESDDDELLEGFEPSAYDATNAGQDQSSSNSTAGLTPRSIPRAVRGRAMSTIDANMIGTHVHSRRRSFGHPDELPAILNPKSSPDAVTGLASVSPPNSRKKKAKKKKEKEPKPAKEPKKEKKRA
jgi:hypothetical protein